MHHIHMGRRRGVAVSTIAALLLLAACGQDLPDGGGADGTTPTTGAPTTQGTEPAHASDLWRVEGITTTAEHDRHGEGLEAWNELVPDAEDITLTASADGDEQLAMWLPPSGDEPKPLLVVLHSWSTIFDQVHGIPFAQWAHEHGWGMIHPNFRGPFDRPEATGSDLAVADIIDAVDFGTDHDGIDEEHVFVVGFSGGGMMSLLVAGRHPDRFAGAAAWVPIHDLVLWHEENVPLDSPYDEEIEASCGGNPAVEDDARTDCLHRSPVTHLDGAREAGVPIYVGHGVDDDVVAPHHSVAAYNQLVDDEDELDPAVLDELSGDAQTAAAGSFFGEQDPPVHLVRNSQEATLVLFEGEHDMVFHPALAWMTSLLDEGG